TTWSGINGNNATERDLDGTITTEDSERFGELTPDATDEPDTIVTNSPNTYVTSDAAPLTVSVEGLIEKTIAATDEPSTGESGGTSDNTNTANPRPVVIGEIITYRLAVTIPDGDIPTINIKDIIPAGMKGVAGSGRFLTSLTGEVPFDGSFETAADGTGTTIADLNALVSVSDIAINVDIPLAKVDAGIGTAANTFWIEYQAVVENIPTNNLSTPAFQGTPELNFTLSDGTVAFNDATPPVAKIVEPQVNVKTYIIDTLDTDNDNVEVEDAQDAANAVPKTPTDTVTIQIEIDSNSADAYLADALDLEMLNALPDGFTFAGNLKLVSGEVPNTLTYDPAQKRVRANFARFPDGGKTIIQFDAIVSQPAVDSDPSNAAINITNTASITYTSLSADNSPNERNGSGTGANTYTDSDPAEISINIPPNTEDAVYSNVVAGSTIPLNGSQLGGSDPDTPTDATNTVKSYIINTLPPVSQGTVYLGAPGDNKPLTVGQELTPAELQTLQFVATAGFVNTQFTYS
ncbi:MAG: hypothetical protein EAZ61_14605, partial [Oscillatoriales cyanobacterium]